MARRWIDVDCVGVTIGYGLSYYQLGYVDHSYYCFICYKNVCYLYLVDGKSLESVTRLPVDAAILVTQTLRTLQQYHAFPCSCPSMQGTPMPKNSGELMDLTCITNSSIINVLITAAEE